MNICLASAFRDSSSYLSRYFEQVIALSDALHERGDTLMCLWGEGDSTDNTLRMLNGARYRIKAEVIDVAHGGPIYGSVVNAERFRQLAHVGRTIFDALPRAADVFVWVESDLIWQAETILGLIDDKVDVVAPRILMHHAWGSDDAFYDVWAFRCEGRHFSAVPPYHSTNDGKSLVAVDSVGSCVVFDPRYIQQVTMDDRVLVGICEDIRSIGGKIWFDPTVPPVIHR